MKQISIHLLNTIDSTNAEARRNIDKCGDLSVWIAEYQTAGRGQRGNSWESTKGLNLTFSILLKSDNILAVNQFIISQMTALSIVDYLFSKGIEAKIKWPNDIYVEERKICGILIENIISGDKLSGSIVGIGLNMNQTRFNSDAPNPTSLLCEKKRLMSNEDEPFDLKEEFNRLLKDFCCLYDAVNTADGTDYIQKRYFEKLYRLGGKYSFEDMRDNTVFEGVIRGVDENARLKIETSDGQIKCFAFKEIKYII